MKLASIFALACTVVAGEVVADDEFLSALASVAGAAPGTPNVGCILGRCPLAVGKCVVNGVCRSALLCVSKCGTDQACAFQCSSDFENNFYDNMAFCMFNKNDCMGTQKGFDTWQMCREEVKPLTTYRGASLTSEVARRILHRGGARGDWIVTKGLSHAYDCLDCQMNYWVKNSDGSMQYEADFKVHKSNGGTRWNHANYVALEFSGEVSRFSLNASSDGGLRHEEDWRLIGADESDEPKWACMYYCGAASGVGMAYEGAMLMTPDGVMPTDNKTLAEIAVVFDKAGLHLQCYPDNTQCSDHPAPPVPPGASGAIAV